MKADDHRLWPIWRPTDMAHRPGGDSADDREMRRDTEGGAAKAPLAACARLEEHSQHESSRFVDERRSGLRSLDATIAPTGEGQVVPP
jgi:hypothetical protein